MRITRRVERLEREIGIAEHENLPRDVTLQFVAAVNGRPANGSVENSVVDTLVLKIPAHRRFHKVAAKVTDGSGLEWVRGTFSGI
jgi:hypothetical protein